MLEKLKRDDGAVEVKLQWRMIQWIFRAFNFLIGNLFPMRCQYVKNLKSAIFQTNKKNLFILWVTKTPKTNNFVENLIGIRYSASDIYIQEMSIIISYKNWLRLDEDHQKYMFFVKKYGDLSTNYGENGNIEHPEGYAYLDELPTFLSIPLASTNIHKKMLILLKKNYVE